MIPNTCETCDGQPKHRRPSGQCNLTRDADPAAPPVLRCGPGLPFWSPSRDALEAEVKELDSLLSEAVEALAERRAPVEVERDAAIARAEAAEEERDELRARPAKAGVRPAP